MRHHPRKRFGQHFLQDAAVIEHILAVIAPEPGQTLVEIGPGRGAITMPLLRRSERLLVVELDRDLIDPLRRRCDGLGHLEILQGDALRVDYCALTEAGTRLRVVGNLPYNVSTPLLFRLMEQARCIVDMHFMLQHEVVERMGAGPGTKNYGRLSVMIQYRCRVTPLFSIPPGAFRPAPRVQSAFVRLQPYIEPPVRARDPASFAALVRKTFSQRRKTIRNSLKGILDQAGIESCGIDPAVRPEQLTIRQFAALADAVPEPVRGTVENGG